MEPKQPINAVAETPKQKPKPARKGLIFASILLIGLVVGTGLVMYKQRSKQNADTVFSINGKRYTHAEVDKLTKIPKLRGLSADESAKQAFEYLKNQAAAKAINIQPTDDQVETARKTIFSRDGYYSIIKSEPWLKLVAYDSVLQSKLRQSADGGGIFKGYSFIFRFGEHLTASQDYTPTGYKDPALIAQDRNYAEGRAKYYQDALKNKKISPDQALAEIKKDPKLGYYNKQNTNLSVHFGDTYKQVSDEVYYKDAADFIKNGAKPGLSDIRTGQTAIIDVPKSDKDYADTFFYIVLLEEGHGNVQAQFKAAQAKINARYKGL